MGAGIAVAEFFDEAAFELGADGVFELFGFFVDAEPLHAKDFGEHALDEVVAAEEIVGDDFAGGSEIDVAEGIDGDELVTFEALEGHGDSGGADMEPAGEGGGDNDLTFAFGFGDGL